MSIFLMAWHGIPGQLVLLTNGRALNNHVFLDEMIARHISSTLLLITHSPLKYETCLGVVAKNYSLYLKTNRFLELF
jgi:hypothetical protein